VAIDARTLTIVQDETVELRAAARAPRGSPRCLGL
jgi:hypothetical protein